MEVKWIKTRKEITKEKLADLKVKGKVKLRKGKSGHAKAQKIASMKDKYE